MKFNIICPKCKAERKDIDLTIETDVPPPNTLHTIVIECEKCGFKEEAN